MSHIKGNRTQLHDEEMPRSVWNGDSCEPLTVKEYLEPQLHPDSNYQNIVNNTRSFVDLLAPRIDLGNYTIGLQDLTSTGRLFDVTCANTDALSEQMLSSIDEKVCQAVTQCLPQSTNTPWIMQWFVEDDVDSVRNCLVDRLYDYSQAENRKSEFSVHWFKTVRDHFQDLTDNEGLFPDSNAAGGRWRGKNRRVRLCVWQYSLNNKPSNDSDSQQVCEQLINIFAQADVNLHPRSAKELYEWLSFWFVPQPDKNSGFGNTRELVDSNPWEPSNTERSLAMIGDSAPFDISRAALHGAAPWTWKKPGLWWFRGQPSRFITIDDLAGEPQIGHLTGERQFGDSTGTLWDQMPDKTIWSMSVVFNPQNEIEEKILRIRRNSVGDDPSAVERRNLANQALTEIATGNPIYRVFCGVFIFGKNLQELNHRTERAVALLVSHRLKPVLPRYDPIALDSYVRALPFGFDPVQDQRLFARRARLWYASHIAKMVPVYGRSNGTGYCGCVLYNRGAEPILFDPLHSKDRQKNAHSVILGPTGAGKTSFIIYLLLQLLAVHRPRIILLSALPTFGLFAAHCENLNLSVNRVRIDGKQDVSLPPFQHAQSLLSQNQQASEDDNLPHRDALGEMEIQARLMITGGQPNEENLLRRDDLDLIRSALVEAARHSRSDGRTQTMTSDLVSALRGVAESQPNRKNSHSKEQRQRAARMASAINVFCTGLNGELFNREGDLWPTCDVTVVELDLLARRGYEDRLAVALTGLFAKINNEVETNDAQNRQTIVVIDEAHVLLQNPLISPYLNRISAMWRTFGAWLWVATQNIRQFPDSAKELLNQPEWWYCLSLDKDEIEQIGRFKSLTNEQKNLLKSARKFPGRYTEGTIISPRLLTLFRNAPPALALALSQTEKDERVKRLKLMQQKNISEIDAAYLIAESIRHNRKTNR